MNLVSLRRLETGPQGTFGVIYAKGKTWKSGELPWKGNQANVSCIPAGRYQCAWTWSAHFNRSLYQILSVPRRAGIRAHSANFMGYPAAGFRSQLNGCIALGEKLGFMEGQKALLLSRPAVRAFEALMERKPFLLEIYEHY